MEDRNEKPVVDNKIINNEEEELIFNPYNPNKRTKPNEKAKRFYSH